MDYMELALKEAKKAFELEEVPVGAIIVKEDKIISVAHNLKETLKDPTAHAEILAIKKACESLGVWRLNGCQMYVTLEPCPMCAWAIVQSRINKLYIGAPDTEAGACGSVINIIQNEYLKSWVEVNWNYNKECSSILSDFFKGKRRERTNG